MAGFDIMGGINELAQTEDDKKRRDMKSGSVGVLREPVPPDPKPSERSASRPASTDATYAEATDLLKKNLEFSKSLRSTWPSAQPGRTQEVPSGYDHAEHLALGKGARGSLWDPGHPSGYYHTPEASVEREQARTHVKSVGFAVPHYMEERPAGAGGSLTSPSSNASVNGTGPDPIRDRLLRQVQNPGASYEGGGSGVPVYRGQEIHSDGGRGSTTQEMAAGRYGNALAQLNEYDRNRSGIGLASAQGEQARGTAAHSLASAGVVPQMAAAETSRAASDSKMAEVAGAKQKMEERVMGFGPLPEGEYGVPPTADQATARLSRPGVGKSALDIINNWSPTTPKPGSDPRYVSDIFKMLEQSGHLSDPRTRQDVAAALYQQHGKEIDRIMAGGNEGALGTLNSMLGRTGPMGEENQLRSKLAALFGDKYTWNANSARKPDPYGIHRGFLMSGGQ